MRVQPNTFYITRGGAKVYIFGLNPFACDEGTDWIGVRQLGGNLGGEEECWTADGHYMTGGSESSLDLVAVWEPTVPPHPLECEGHTCRFCAALDHQPCGASHPDCPRNTEKPE